MKGNRIFSMWLAVLGWAVWLMIPAFIAFAQDPAGSDAEALRESISHTKQKIAKYKSCISEERPGDIMLYLDPGTGECMAITTATLKEYLKEKGLSSTEIKERLTVFEERSSEVRRHLEQDIQTMDFQVRELEKQLSQRGKETASSGTSRGPTAVQFDYPAGMAEADGRDAELHLVIDGTEVKGRMTAHPVCKIGIRLPKTDIAFAGTVDGLWEDKDSMISADWKGGEYGCNGGLMKERPREGRLTIRMRSNKNPSQPDYSVFLKRDLGTSYGYVFTPLGKTNKPKKTPPSGNGIYDISGVWDEGHGIWTFTRVTDNTYKARYEGDFAGEGIAVTQGNRLLIDFAADNLKVHHDLVVSKDGKRAEGTWTSSDGESETTVLVYKGGSGTPIISLDAAPPATLPPGFKTGAPPPAFASAYADRLRRHFTAGIIRLQVGERHVQVLPKMAGTRRGFDSSMNSTGMNTDPCIELPTVDVLLTPASLATTRRVGSGVEIRAKTKGKGELWVRGRVRCKRPDGSRYEAQTITIYVVLVGGEAIGEIQKPGEVDGALISGRAVMRDTGEPVADALITVYSDRLGSAQDPSWKTDADGSFSVTVKADRYLNAGTYKISIFKRNPAAIPGKCRPRDGMPPGIGNDCDQWQVRDYTVTLKKGGGRIDAGTIHMDYVRNIPSMRGRDDLR